MLKKVLLTLLALVVAIPLVFCGTMAVAYFSTTEASVPALTLTVMGKEVAPAGYTWSEPVFAGMMFREFAQGETLEAVPLGELTEPTLNAAFPDGCDAQVRIKRGDEQVFSGLAAELGGVQLQQNGEYLFEAVCDVPRKGSSGYGRFTFRASFTLALEPDIQASAERVAQGDVLAILVTNLGGDLVPTAESCIGMVTFTPAGDNRMVAYVPIAYNREVGDYTVTVTAGGTVWELPFTVAATDFARQNLQIDTSDPVIGEANSPAAYQQYRDRIYPLFETADPARYWSGPFLIPTAGRVSTEYGLMRYTNDDPVPSRHVGIDLAADEGTPVIAPAAGRVVMAEYLLNTGNTIVIEHGGGLKSYFFHMSALAVQEGDMVARGDEIGAVGTTGYSTGPHLHYEVRIGNQSINPSLLWSGKGGLLAFE